MIQPLTDTEETVDFVQLFADTYTSARQVQVVPESATVRSGDYVEVTINATFSDDLHVLCKVQVGFTGKYIIYYCFLLTLSQTSPGFYVSAVHAF